MHDINTVCLSIETILSEKMSQRDSYSDYYSIYLVYQSNTYITIKKRNNMNVIKTPREAKISSIIPWFDCNSNKKGCNTYCNETFNVELFHLICLVFRKNVLPSRIYQNQIKILFYYQLCILTDIDLSTSEQHKLEMITFYNRTKNGYQIFLKECMQTITQ